MREFFAAIAVGVLFALVPSRSNAELISLDLFAPGDGLLTRDTVSGMEWLDLTQSSCRPATNASKG